MTKLDKTTSEWWKDIKGWEGFYQISNHGRMRSLERFVHHKSGRAKRKGKMLSFGIGPNGYYVAQLHRNGENKSVRVNRLVLEAFVLNPDNYPICNHRDGDKKNNHALNLEWCTHSQNTKHAFKIGLYQKDFNKGIKNGKSKLTKKQVLEIREKYIPRKYSTYKLAKEYMVGHTSIHNIVSRKSWKHL